MDLFFGFLSSDFFLNFSLVSDKLGLKKPFKKSKPFFIKGLLLIVFLSLSLSFSSMSLIFIIC